MSSMISELSQLVSNGLNGIDRGQERHAHGLHKEIDAMSLHSQTSKVLALRRYIFV